MSLGIRSIQINISVAQCMQQNLKEAILPILQKYHIPTSMIVLELTESTAINAPALMEHHMKELGDAGISLRWMIMEPEVQTALILCGFRSRK